MSSTTHKNEVWNAWYHANKENQLEKRRDRRRLRKLDLERHEVDKEKARVYRVANRVAIAAKDKLRKKEFYDRNSIRVLDRALDNRLKRLYGITRDDYNHILLSQDGGCAICGKQSPPRRGRLAVDHDHVTGQIRGLLCSKCNQAIGLLSEQPALLRKAAQYLVDSLESGLYS